MAEEGEALCSDEKEDMCSTMAGEPSTKDKLQEKKIKLRPTSIYRLKCNRLNDLRENLVSKTFEEIELKQNWPDYGFHVQLFTRTKESTCNLVNVMKCCIKNDEHVKTYTRDTFIFIAESNSDSLKGAFAICTGAGYLAVLPYVDSTFSYSVSKKILDPKTVGQLKCRYINGKTISITKLFHKDKNSPNLPNIINDSFFIADGFQAEIKSTLNPNLGLLSTLHSMVKVTRFSLQIMKNLYMSDMLGLMKSLLSAHLLTNSTDAEEFEFLTYVIPVQQESLIQQLDLELNRAIFDQNTLKGNGFYLCHDNYKQWVKCEQVELSVKGKNCEKPMTKTWDSRPDILDIVDELSKGNRDWSSVNIRYKSKGKWQQGKFLDYIHGHVLYKKIHYFHIGKNWFHVEVEYIRRMEHAFFKLVDEKLLLEENEGYLPLPWCSEKYSNEQINADHCIAFCTHVLRKDLSMEDETKMKNIDMKELLRSPHNLQDDEKKRMSSANSEEGNNPPVSDSHAPVNDDENKQSASRKETIKQVMSQLSLIIGEVESKLCLNSLMYRDEAKYNENYILLNKFLEDNPVRPLNGISDPANEFPTYLLGDKILVENVELCDILKITEHHLYLYHVKEGFGQKTRDAASQIRISANLIRKAKESNAIDSILGKYYEQITKRNGEDQTRKQQKEDGRNLSKEKFLELFETKKIVYVYAFLDDTKQRIPFNKLLLEKQSLIQTTDIYAELNANSSKTRDKIDLLCESLTSNSILVKNGNGFSIGTKFMDFRTKDLIQIFENKMFTKKKADTLFRFLQRHFVPTVSIKSHIAKFELLKLAHDFINYHSDFELRFCQIKKP